MKLLFSSHVLKFNTLMTFCLLGVLSVPAVAQAQEPPLPKADANGNYYTGKGRAFQHRTWVVVDPDPNALNCRRETDKGSVSLSMPVVTRFRSGTTLTTPESPAGFALITSDERGQRWLKVLTGSKDQTCYVRANNKFIRPTR
ncbi:MAG: hypothetical protein ACKO7R_05320 [Pseudanabaena sp.]